MSKYRSVKNWQKYKQVCAEIWEERNAQCEKCGRQLFTPRKHNFNHTAGRTKNLCNKATIQLLCYRCHCRYHGIKETQTWLDNP